MNFILVLRISDFDNYKCIFCMFDSDSHVQAVDVYNVKYAVLTLDWLQYFINFLSTFVYIIVSPPLLYIGS
jgi:hypothetical protein